MKQTSIRIIAIVLVVLLGLVGIIAVAIEAFSGTAIAEDAPARDKYEVSLQLLDQLEAVRVEQVLTYTNRTGQAQDRVLFSLYANAYRRQLTAPFELEAMQSAYPEGFTPGGADFFLIEVNGREADWGVQGDAESVLRVACDLKPGETAEFRFGYELLLPRAKGDLGVTEIGWQLGNVLVLAAPWDEALQAYDVISVSPVGENRFADAADFSVTLDAPRGCQVTSAGSVTKAENGERDSWTIEAEGVRGLPLFVSNRYQKWDRKAESGYNVSAYMLDGGNANFALEVATLAIDFFEQTLGKLPTPSLSLVQLDSANKMQPFSGVIALDSAALGWDKRDALEYLIVKAIARQYFGEAVGNNPMREPWLSETIPSYLALCYYEHRYGHTKFLEQLNLRALPALKLTIAGNVRIDSERDQFQTGSEYEMVLDNRGMAAMYEIGVTIGQSTLLSAMRLYVEQHRGQVASMPDFAAALDQAAGRELDALLVELLQNITDYVPSNTEWYE